MRSAIKQVAVAIATASAMVSAPGAFGKDGKPDLAGEKALAAFAQCAVRAAPGEAAMVIDTAPDSAEEQARLDMLFRRHGDCFKFASTPTSDAVSAAAALGQLSAAEAARELAGQRQQMAFSRRVLRGAIATRLYLDLDSKAWSTGPLPPPAAAAGLPAGYVVVRCAAAQDPIDADRLVRSKRLSPAETDAGRAFAPALNGCARGMGRIDMTGTAIHGWAAEALYVQRRPVATEGR